MPEITVESKESVSFHQAVRILPGDETITIVLPSIPEGNVFNGIIEVKGDIIKETQE